MNLYSQVKYVQSGEFMRPEIIEPTHQKGRESQERIVRATLALIKEVPFDQLTIAQIMEEAGMAVGTFYRRFKTKESVLPFVFKAYDELFERWASSFEDENPRTPGEAIELIVRKTAQLFLKNAGLIRTVHLYNRLHPRMSNAPPNRGELSRLMGAVLAKDFHHPSRDDLLRGRMAVLTMVSAMTEQILYCDLPPTTTTNLRNKDVHVFLVKMMGALAA